MKFIIFFVLVFFTSLSYAQTVKLKGRCGQVRHGGYFSNNPVFTSFNTEVELKLARLGVNVSQMSDDYPYTDAIVEYNHKFNPNTFYRLHHEAFINGTVKIRGREGNPSLKIEFKIKCAGLVQDGGNQTLKMSCVNKLAKTIKKLVKDHD